MLQRFIRSIHAEGRKFVFCIKKRVYELYQNLKRSARGRGGGDKTQHFSELRRPVGNGEAGGFIHSNECYVE